ncbi:hypothetical protein MBLNU459_g5308t2 [Dothideomycetes sp. NU459]
MDALLDQARTIWEGQIDFEGQRLAELMSTVLLTTTGFLAFFAGYISQNIHYTLWTLLGGSALTFVACVPPWPMFNQSPVRWLPAKTMPKGYVGAAGQGFDITVDGKKVQ